MKAILTKTETMTPYECYKNYNLKLHQDLIIYGEGVEFDVKMRSDGSFKIPHDCDIEVKMSFKFTPREPESVTVLLQ